MAELYASIIISLIVVVLYETEIFMPGILETDTNTEFMIVSLMEILTICMLPLALRLFKFKKISNAVTDEGAQGLARWGSVRIMMICLPMVINTLLYYLSGLNVAFGYMAIICLICVIFVYPSMSRCMAETNCEE